MAFLTFASILCLWACLCWGIYGTLRLLEKKCPFVLNVFGSIFLAFWIWAYLLLVCVAGLSLDSNAQPPHRSALGLIEVGGLLLFSLLFGGFITRHATQKQLIWWHGVLFCALYIPLSHGFAGLILNATGLLDFLAVAFDRIGTGTTQTPGSGDWGFLVGILVWLFPLGAPMSEIAFHSFQRILASQRE